MPLFAFFTLCKPVVLIRKHEPGLEFLRFFNVHHGIRGNNRDITGYEFPGSRAIEANDPASFFSFDHIGFDPFPIVDIQHMNLLIFDQVGCNQKVLINGDTAN